MCNFIKKNGENCKNKEFPLCYKHKIIIIQKSNASVENEELKKKLDFLLEEFNKQKEFISKLLLKNEYYKTEIKNLNKTILNKVLNENKIIHSKNIEIIDIQEKLIVQNKQFEEIKSDYDKYQSIKIYENIKQKLNNYVDVSKPYKLYPFLENKDNLDLLYNIFGYNIVSVRSATRSASSGANNYSNEYKRLQIERNRAAHFS